MDLPPDLEKAKDEIKGYAGAYGLDGLTGAFSVPAPAAPAR